MKKSVKVMAAAMAAMMALAGCGSKTAETTAADTKAAETTTQAAEESSADAAEAPEVAEGEYTVGIGQFAEHGSLDNCRTGFLQGLADEGIVEGKNLTVLYENAQADGGTASQIMNELSASTKNAGAETVPASNDITKLDKSINAIDRKSVV